MSEFIYGPDPKASTPAKKNDGFNETGTAKKIVNEQDQQNVSNGETGGGANDNTDSSVQKPQLNEDSGEQRDFSNDISLEAERKKDAGINP